MKPSKPSVQLQKNGLTHIRSNTNGSELAFDAKLFHTIFNDELNAFMRSHRTGHEQAKQEP